MLSLEATCEWRKQHKINCICPQCYYNVTTKYLTRALCASSIAVHYLGETGMFRFSDTDMYQVTPLHLAASTGNTEVVRYLLREQV